MFLITLLLAMLASPITLQDQKGELTVVVTDLRNNDGVIWIILYNSPDDFLKEGSAGYRRDKGVISQNKSTVTFKDLPYGEYAVAFIHDENSNQNMDHNKIKIPKEGFGISNNPKMRLGPPKYDAAKFALTKKAMHIKIKTKYLL